MRKNYVENSLKRFLKRKVKITMGFVVAFMIMGTGVFAEDKYYANKDNIILTKDDVKLDENGEVSIKVNTSGLSEEVNRFTALGAEAGKTLNLTTDGKINIINDDTVAAPQRLYAIAVNGGASANITAEEIDLNISATGNTELRALRNNESQLTINSDIKGTLTSESAFLRAIDCWEGGTTTVNGNIDLSLTSKDGTISAIGARNEGNITVNGNSNININSETGRIVGVENFANSGKKIEFNGDLKTTLTKGENNGQHIQGVLGYQSTTNFNGDTEINIINNSNKTSNIQNHIVDIQCDPGNAHETVINFNGDRTKLSLTSTGTSTDVNVGIRASGKGPGSVNFNGKEVIIEMNSKNSNNVMALASQYGANITSKADNKMIINVKNEVNNQFSNTYGIYSSPYAGYNGNVTLNGSVDIRVEANNGKAYGITNVTSESKSDEDGKVLIEGDLKILAISKGEAAGVFVNGKNAITDINGNTIIEVKGNEDSYALNALDKGKIDITGKDKLVQITGDINAETEGTISANLSTSDSFITGTITDNNADGTVNIGMDNGATWNNTGNSSVTNLTLNNGIINNDSVDNNISVGTLLGNGGTVNMAAVIDETTGKATSGKVTIDNIEKENVKLDVNFKNSGTVEADGDKAQKYFEELAENIKTNDTDSKITGTAALDEGFVSGGYEADITINKDGSKVENVTYTGLNSMVEGMRDLATINLLTWRQEMNSLNKRMGELRNSTGEHGIWSRVYTGKIENGSKYDNDYQTYQVGYDKKYTVDNGVMFVGGLVSYTDGETDYALGHGENYSVGAGIYATWLNNDGQFADVVLKQSRLHNKFDVTSKNGNKSQSGDYNNWGTSLSGQYGKRFDLNDKFFVEPSVELTLGRVEDTTYTTSAGVDVHQDTMYSLVGNVGTSVGYKFSDKGNVYARAALVKEFQGDIDTEYEKDGALERTSEDLGDTWAEFGVGVNYRFVENMNVYVDVQKTGEATVDNKWQANLGFRYEF